MVATEELQLPRADGRCVPYTLGLPSSYGKPASPFRSRLAYAAAHVVADPLADHDPSSETRLDWEATVAYRRHLWEHGFSVAEAMDTAQRGMGLDWGTTRELIARSLAEARATGMQNRITCGAGTDQLTPQPGVTLGDVTAAYEEQCGFVEGEGGRVILMASRALVDCAKGPDDYAAVYGRILSQVKEPVIIHWLGDMFDPSLAGYWGSKDLSKAMQTALDIIGDHADKVDGIKISLLDDQREIEMRRLLPEGVRMYSGDDFNYPDLIKGDDQGHSDALLGIFDAIAPLAAAALATLDAGNLERYDEIFAPTVPLSRHMFKAPTRFYKTGVVFLAWLNDHQDHFRMVGGQESCRSVVHLSELFRLADAAHLFTDPERATARMRSFLEVAGVTQ